MNASAFLEGYLYKYAMMSEAGIPIDTFTSPTGNPAPQTDPKIKDMEKQVKNETLENVTQKEIMDKQGI